MIARSRLHTACQIHMCSIKELEQAFTSQVSPTFMFSQSLLSQENQTFKLQLWTSDCEQMLTMASKQCQLQGT